MYGVKKTGMRGEPQSRVRLGVHSHIFKLGMLSSACSCKHWYGNITLASSYWCFRGQVLKQIYIYESGEQNLLGRQSRVKREPRIDLGGALTMVGGKE